MSSIEETLIARRDAYADDPEAMECFDDARKYGLSAVFYPWPVGEE